MVMNDAYFSICHFDIRATCGMVLSWIKSRIWAFSLESACSLGSHRKPPCTFECLELILDMCFCVSGDGLATWPRCVHDQGVFYHPPPNWEYKTFNRRWVIDGPLKLPLQADWLFSRLTEIPRTNSMVLAWGSAMPANCANQTFLKLPISNVQQRCFSCVWPGFVSVWQ